MVENKLKYAPLKIKEIYLQIIAVLAATLVIISDGMQFGWTAPTIPVLLGPNSPIQITKHEAEYQETILMLGAFPGVLVTTYLVDKIGRKRSILLASFVSLLEWITIGVANRIEYIYVARFFAGMTGDMAFVSVSIYIAEIADQKVRGFLTSIVFLMMIFGIVIIYSTVPFVAFYVPSIIGGGLVVVEMLVFPFMPESPYYLLYKERHEEAKKSFQYFRPNKNVDAEFEAIVAAVNRQKNEKGRIKDLFLVKSNRKAILIMTVLNAAQHMCSLSVILMNLHSIIKTAGAVYIRPSIAAIVFAVIMLVTATITSYTVDKYGRKILLMVSGTLTGICLLIIAIYFTLKRSGFDVLHVSWIPIASIMVYAAVFELGLGMVPIVMAAELFPTKMKALGMTLSDAIYFIFAIISLQLYHQLARNYGIQVPFFIFAGYSFLAVTFTFFFVPETKGKSLDEIQFLLKGEILLTTIS